MTDAENPMHTNRLADATSPYLLQHAHNPVDWYPWGEEALARARSEEKPILLSIGYSACHWCHVMENESFEDEEIARILNDKFVSIKVDREERPDIDKLYMKTSMLMTGSGGWPLTIIMTPDKKPFYAGTYIPKKSRFGRIGLMTLIPQINEFWKNQRARVKEIGESIVKSLNQISPLTDFAIDNTIFNICYKQLEASYDEENG